MTSIILAIAPGGSISKFLRIRFVRLFSGKNSDDRFLKDKKHESPKRGAGSQSKTKVLVMAESEEVENPKNPDKPKKVGHVKMVVIPDLKSKTISPIAGGSVDAEASVVSDGTKSHVKFPEMFREYVGCVISVDEIGKVLP